MQDYVESTERGSIAFITSMWYILRNIGVTKLSSIEAQILEYLPTQGKKLMKSIAEDLEEKGVKKGMEKGIEKEKVNNATRMLKAGSDLKFIHQITTLSIADIQKLKKSLK